jgi:hypothetical protein
MYGAQGHNSVSMSAGAWQGGVSSLQQIKDEQTLERFSFRSTFVPAIGCKAGGDDILDQMRRGIVARDGAK